MKRIISGMLSAVARKSGSSPEILDLNRVLSNRIDLLKSKGVFNGKISLEMKCGDLPLISGVYSHFNQCFGNLISNALDAMYENDEGVLTIESAFDNENIIIKISDTGHGIPKEKMALIFNPFFTSKPPTAVDGRPTGTGLGLPSCREMIESYGGEIQVYSKVGKGSAFAVRLPVKKVAK